MYHSYVMGIDDTILALRSKGFDVRNDGGNYTVSFPEEKSAVWEQYILSHLELGYWNEYITEDAVIFLFHLPEGIKRYVVHDFCDPEVLSLCEQLCDCKFGSIKQMLTGNHYYKTIIPQ